MLRLILLGRYTEERIKALVGIDRAGLRKHLESLFLPGMSWQNYGVSGWCIDHKMPCSRFNLLDEAQVKACFHFSNLQPLWYSENRRKSVSL